MAKAEQSFPRGGYSREAAEDGNQNSDEPEQIFGSNTSKKAKNYKKQSSQSNNNSIELEPFSMTVSDRLIPDNVDLLTHQKIKDGMTLMGCIRSSTAMSIEVELPGRNVGRIYIRDISNEYTRYLAEMHDIHNSEEALSYLTTHMRPGRFLPVKVIRTMQNDSKIDLSIKPDDVNAGLSHRTFLDGMMVWVSVIEKSDHCYNLNVGVPNCTVVLPFEKAKTGSDYHSGECFWCIVQKTNIQQQATILTVSTLDADVNGVFLKKKPASLDNLSPGMQVHFTVQTVLKDGLRGTIFGNYVSFISTINLAAVFDIPQNYKVGQKLSTRVLYIQPTTKFTYLTLQGIADVPPPTIKVGTKIKATVISRLGRGLYLRLNQNSRGVAPYRRICKRFMTDVTTDANVADAMKKKYPSDANFHCRVINYVHMERVYVCTNETDVMGEKYFTIADIKIGALVSAKVKDIVKAGIVVTVGRVQGFIQNIHLCDIQYSDNIKKKFKVGQNLKGKVLSLKENHFNLTLKGTLIGNDTHLTAWEQIEPDREYPAIVIYYWGRIVHVAFYNGFNGQLDTSNIDNMKHDMKHLFYQGKMVMTVVDKIEDGIPILKMPSSSSTESNISNKRKNGVSVEAVNGDAEASLDEVCDANSKKNKKKKTSEGSESVSSEKEAELNLKKSINGKNGKNRNISEGSESEASAKEEVLNSKKSTNSKKSKKQTVSEDSESESSEKEEVLNSKKSTNSKKSKCKKISDDSESESSEKEEVLNSKKSTNSKKSKNKKTSEDSESESSEKEEELNLKKSKKKKQVQKIVEENTYNGEANVLPVNSNLKVDKKGKRKKFETAEELNDQKKRQKKSDQSENTDIPKHVTLTKVTGLSKLPGVKGFFTSSVTDTPSTQSDSDSDYENTLEERLQISKRKAKKAAIVDRREAERREEERLIKLERDLADGEGVPQSVEQFERALLAFPTSSMIWAEYVAFHLQFSEIDKARAAAKRALQTIPQTKLQERLNIWIVYLTLEHKFGTKDLYDEIFKDAISCNDPLPIYLTAIELHVSKNEYNDVEMKWRKLKRDHKHNLQMWCKVAKIFYDYKKFDEARRLKDDAIRIITDNKTLTSLIVQFAIMEFTLGEVNQGEALFETLLQSDPKRVDIWSTYVDQLVKNDSVDLARRVLERAVSYKLPVKRLTVLYKKLYAFEKQHGDDDQQDNVLKMAAKCRVSLT